VEPVGAGVGDVVADFTGFGAGRAEWTRDEAATGRVLVNGNVCAMVAAAIRYPPISATAVPAAISPRRRTDHELLDPPDDG
jgi:hypothetical protein